MEEQEKVAVEPKKTKRIKRRVILVLGFLVVFLLFAFLSYRGSYLEMLEIGEKYIDVFQTNLRNKYGMMFINFIILFVAIYYTNRRSEKG